MLNSSAVVRCRRLEEVEHDLLLSSAYTSRRGVAGRRLVAHLLQPQSGETPVGLGARRATRYVLRRLPSGRPRKAHHTLIYPLQLVKERCGTLGTATHSHLLQLLKAAASRLWLTVHHWHSTTSSTNSQELCLQSQYLPAQVFNLHLVPV